MPRIIVGGRDFGFDRNDVERIMRDVEPEPIREHLVEIAGKAFPPKQVIAQVTGWSRQSYTTMEAQRVLNRLGFVCRRQAEPGTASPEPSARPDTATPDERLTALEATVAVIHEAVAGLRNRVAALETGSR